MNAALHALVKLAAQHGAVPIVVPQGGAAKTRIFTDPEGPVDVMVIEEPLYGTAEVGADGWVQFTASGEHEGGDWMAVVVTRGGHEEIVQVDIDIARRNYTDMGCATAPLRALGMLGLAGLLVARRRR